MKAHPGYIWSRLIHIRGLRAVAFLLVTAGIFAAIAISIHLPGLALIDHHVTQTLQLYRSPAADLIFFSATFLGNTITLCAIAALVSIAMFVRGHRHAGLLMLLTLLSLPLDMTIKTWAVRPRPEDVLILLPRTGFSFPSGHALGSTTVYGFMAAMVWIRAPAGTIRLLAAFALGFLPILIGTSRIYVGAHWLSDVVAGMSVGAFLLVPLVAYYKHWHRVTPATPAPSGGPPVASQAPPGA